VSEQQAVYETTYQRTLARQPKRCPRCGSGEIAPLFDGDLWDCAAPGCGNVWSATSDE